MRFEELTLFYGLAAVAMALALYRRGRTDLWTALLWPLTLPAFLAHTNERFDTVQPLAPLSDDSPIERLQTALALLDVTTDIGPLGTGLVDLTVRRKALAELLADTALREDNRAALVELHTRLSAERQVALDRIEDLVTTIHLAHYGGRSLDRIDDQLADLLAMVEGVAEVGGVPSHL